MLSELEIEITQFSNIDANLIFSNIDASLMLTLI